MFNSDEYQPDYGRVAIDDFKFNEEFKSHLITSYDELYDVLDPIKNMKVGFDTETTGLTFYKDHIVGVSFATNPYEGYYVPIRHIIGNNIVKRNEDVKPIFDLIYDKLLIRNNIVLYNATFDLIMYESEGYNPNKISCFDAQILVYLLDTNFKDNGLKTAQRLILGRDVPDFQDLVGKNYTFDMLRPQDGCYYAACDAAGTLALYKYLYPILKKECPFIIKLDNQLNKNMVYYLQNPIYIDSKKMKTLEIEVREKIKQLDRKIFQTVGYPFEIQSNPQTALALKSLGIDTGEETPTGQMSLKEETLKKLNNPFCDLIVERRSLLKQLTSYIQKFTEVDSGHVSYRLTNVPTGRLSSGNSGRGKKYNSYFLPLNFQNLTKAKSQMYEVHKSNSITNILGYDFFPIKETNPEVIRYQKEKGISKYLDAYIELFPNQKICEAHKQELNIRNAVTVPDNDREKWYFVSIDYVAQELKVAGNLSGEPNLIEPFLNNEDLHKKTAINIWGKENYSSNKRKDAKAANFGLLYHGTVFSLMRSTGKSEAECQDIYDGYWKVMNRLLQWIRSTVDDAKYHRKQTTYTYFKRPRRLRWYLNHRERKKHKFAERTVTSHFVQGTCSDIMRIDLVNLYSQIFSNPKTFDEIRFVGTVHDEILYCIRKDKFDYWIDKILSIMTIHLEDWPLVLTNSVEVGYSYGWMFEFEKNKNGKWIPK